MIVIQKCVTIIINKSLPLIRDSLSWKSTHQEHTFPTRNSETDFCLFQHCLFIMIIISRPSPQCKKERDHNIHSHRGIRALLQRLRHHHQHLYHNEWMNEWKLCHYDKHLDQNDQVTLDPGQSELKEHSAHFPVLQLCESKYSFLILSTDDGNIARVQNCRDITTLGSLFGNDDFNDVLAMAMAMTMKVTLEGQSKSHEQACSLTQTPLDEHLLWWSFKWSLK